MAALPIKEVIEVVDLAKGEVAYFRNVAAEIGVSEPSFPIPVLIEIERGEITRMRFVEMSTNRRTLISMMGLLPAGAALGAESFVGKNDEPGQLQATVSLYTNEAFAQAFERMAAAARAGALTVSRIKVESELGPDTIADMSTLTFSLVHHPEIKV